MQARFNAYPNPFDGQQISLDVQGFENGTLIPIKVYNLLGVPVYENDLEGSNQGPSTQLNFIQHLPAGIYFIQAGNLEPQKIVVK